MTSQLASAGPLSAVELLADAERYLVSGDKDGLTLLQAAVVRRDRNAAARAWSALESYLAIAQQFLGDAEAAASQEDPADRETVEEQIAAIRQIAGGLRAEAFRLACQVDPNLAWRSVRARRPAGAGFGSPIPPLAEMAVDSAGESERNGPTTAMDQATAGPAAEVPHRREMERAFGEDFAGVRAHLGQASPMAAMNAQAAARGEKVAFASSSPSPPVVAHELTHVVQNRRNGHATKTGQVAALGLEPEDSPAEREADAVAGHIAEQGLAKPLSPIRAVPAASLQLSPAGAAAVGADSASASNGSAIASHEGKERGERLGQAFAHHGVKDASRARTITWSTRENVRGDIVQVDHEYVYALTGERESGTSGLLITRRTMHVELQANTRFATLVEVEITGSARYDANLEPSDLEKAALTWPAVVAEQSAAVRVHGVGARNASLSGKPHANGQTLADTVAQDHLLAYETPAEQRIWAVRDLVAQLEQRDRHEAWLGQKRPLVEHTIAELDAYRAAIDAQQSSLSPKAPSRLPLEQATELLDELAVAGDSSTDPNARHQTRELHARLRSAYLRAHHTRLAEPPLGAGVFTSIAETAKMGRDLAYKAADHIGEATGAWDLQWEAKSGIGTMREQGQGWGEITVAMVDGVVDQIENVIRSTADGDFRPLADFSLEAAFGMLTGGPVGAGLVKAGKTSARAGLATLSDARAGVARLAARATEAAAKLGEEAPSWVKEELSALGRAGGEALQSPQPRLAGAGSVGAGGASRSSSIDSRVPIRVFGSRAPSAAPRSRWLPAASVAGPTPSFKRSSGSPVPQGSATWRESP